MTHAADTLPLDAASPTPLGAYQKWRDEPLKDWRESNARVEEIGGWRTYLREAQQGSGDATAPGMHDHHHGH